MNGVSTNQNAETGMPDVRTPVTVAMREELVLGAHAHVWAIALQPASEFVEDSAVKALLDAVELRRAERFLVPEARSSFLQCRAALRTLLGGYLGRHPASIALGVAEHGKPVLREAADVWLSFNVSHSDRRALVALACRRQLGVDVERIRDDLDHEEMAAHHFAHQERVAIAQLPAAQRCDAFFACWTRKEAYLKATGSGLLTPLDSFHVVTATPHSPARVEVIDQPEASNRWTLHDVPLPPGYAGALAVEGPAVSLRMLDYPSPG